MLKSAVSLVGERIDAFQIDSLPDSYRQTFSAGGDWVESLSKLVLRKSEPLEQFKRLSALLGTINSQLLFIVEDLDRSDTKQFEIQEVVALLERLKEHKNLKFVLTGGVSTTNGIDFDKLCDHIETLQLIEPSSITSLIERIQNECRETKRFPQVSIGFDDQRDRFKMFSDFLIRDVEELTFAESLARLLSTPRALRHALGHTRSAWQTLHGEVDLEHLLSSNILRYGAPECFQFLTIHWDRLVDDRSRSGAFSKEQYEVVRKSIASEWEKISTTSSWNQTAAFNVMCFLIPQVEYWIKGAQPNSVYRKAMQGIGQRRYWYRILNERIEDSDVRDQEILRDISSWVEEPVENAELIRKLSSNKKYADLWEDLAPYKIPHNVDSLRMLCGQVLHGILRERGAFACHSSIGFGNVWRHLQKRISGESGNAEWLMDQITFAAETSLDMVNALWHYFGSPGRYSLLQSSQSEGVRQHILHLSKSLLVDRESIETRLNSAQNATIYQLVFNPGEQPGQFLAGVETWNWLSLTLLDGLRHGDAKITANCACLVQASSVPGQPYNGVRSIECAQFRCNSLGCIDV